ncbi:hypothetical protein HU200_015981 [Digitaria exilis]|uniref:Uncharacterized protein n=1 Tax=Digitaria exilis TaxID=1010633 RepID=A0A835KHS1_9POAL|nr:hypothetical protein HU200_015981 [Digitaria exilis]
MMCSKIIGARVYDHDQGSISGLSPLDEVGHGSHTASTVAGRAVANVSYGGLAAGTARGAVPGARLAIYKVCVGEFCSSADILAGFDDAIADGVDIISFSIGGMFPMQYFESAQAIGSFHAMRRGVLTSASAGNSGLDGGHVCNVAPWMLSVAASSIDRRFVDTLVLGNGDTIVGTSINTFPTVVNAALAFPPRESCDPDNLRGGSYRGKILLCPHDGSDGQGPLLAGAAGIVLVTDSPDVAFEQSRCNSGQVRPNHDVCQQHKPDLSAPGIDIIASWSPIASPKVPYNIISGTSMACPHASGAAAYVKSFHRDWSPAMIMSALITTATPMNTPGNSKTTAFKYGAGQLNPVKANDPGHVYDASESDYIAMLCVQGYNATQLTLITGSNTTVCPDGSRTGSPSDLNYPTMAAHVEAGKNFNVSFPRTATNVGAASDAYDVKIIIAIEAAKDIAIVVSPSKLEFSAQNQKITFTVTVSGVPPLDGQVHSAAIVWYNNEHEVRSPVVVYTEADW